MTGKHEAAEQAQGTRPIQRWGVLVLFSAGVIGAIAFTVIRTGNEFHKPKLELDALDASIRGPFQEASPEDGEFRKQAIGLSERKARIVRRVALLLLWIVIAVTAFLALRCICLYWSFVPSPLRWCLTGALVIALLITFIGWPDGTWFKSRTKLENAIVEATLGKLEAPKQEESQPASQSFFLIDSCRELPAKGVSAVAENNSMGGMAAATLALAAICFALGSWKDGRIATLRRREASIRPIFHSLATMLVASTLFHDASRHWWISPWRGGVAIPSSPKGGGSVAFDRLEELVVSLTLYNALLYTLMLAAILMGLSLIQRHWLSQGAKTRRGDSSDVEIAEVVDRPELKSPMWAPMGDWVAVFAPLISSFLLPAAQLLA